MTNDILFKKYRIDCIPIKIYQDHFWPDKKTIVRNPFKFLESDELVRQIVHRVEYDYGFKRNL